MGNVYHRNALVSAPSVRARGQQGNVNRGPHPVPRMEVWRESGLALSPVAKGNAQMNEVFPWF